MRQKFHEAWERKRGRVVYIDELDAMARAREEASESYAAQIVSQLLVLLDGPEAKRQAKEKPFKVIASTNLGHNVDPALRRPGRLGASPLRFELPDRKVREAVFHYYLQKIYQKDKTKLEDDLISFITEGKKEAMEPVLNKTASFSGADIEDLISFSAYKAKEGKLSVEMLCREAEEFEKISFGVGTEVLESQVNPELKTYLDESIGSDTPTVVRIDDNCGEEEAKSIARTYFGLNILG